MKTIFLTLAALVFVLWLYLILRPSRSPRTIFKIIAKSGLLLIVGLLVVMAFTT